MASLLAHAAVPLVVSPALRNDVAPGVRRRLALLAVLCAWLPDLDLASYLFEIRPPQLLGHRGLTHSPFFAALLALALAAIWLRSLTVGSRAWWKATVLLFLAGASHGLLDALTVGDVGVALLAPFSAARFLAPIALLPVCPLGVSEYLGRWGLETFANEALYVIAPLALLAWLVRIQREGGELRRGRTVQALRAVVVWALAVAVLRIGVPSCFAPYAPRILRAATGEDEDPSQIPHDDLPGKKLVTRLDELKALGLFDRELEPAHPLWSSSFFPWWFGGESGRWQEGRFRLAWRTLFGFAPPTDVEARRWLEAADRGDASAKERLFTLAPTEKLDLAYGQLDFPLTRASLAKTHNGSPRYWYGRCNGISAAAMDQPEPFRAVDLIGLDGRRIRLHPNDIKALLAVAYYTTQTTVPLGGKCNLVSFDSGDTCSMNPAGLVLALLNRVGLAKQSFMIDVLPTPANQYYPVAKARVDLVGSPRAPGPGDAMEPELAPRVKSLQDVRIALTMSSTTLPYAPADVPDPAAPDAGRYLRVGLRAEHFEYRATLALGEGGELLGGRWNGHRGDGPDNAVFVSGGPYLEDAQQGTLRHELLKWPLIRELARASVQEGDAVPTVDLRTRCDGRCPP